MIQQAEPLPLDKQSLLLDGLRRVEQHSPIWVLPRLITTLNLHEHLTQARQRLCDSHRATMKDAGVDVESCSSGGINVQGDTTINGLGTLGTVAVVLLALCAGAGACALLYRHYCGAPFQPTNNVTIEGAKPESVENWRLGLRVTDAP